MDYLAAIYFFVIVMAIGASVYKKSNINRE